MNVIHTCDVCIGFPVLHLTLFLVIFPLSWEREVFILSAETGKLETPRRKRNDRPFGFRFGSSSRQNIPVPAMPDPISWTRKIISCTERNWISGCGQNLLTIPYEYFIRGFSRDYMRFFDADLPHKIIRFHTIKIQQTTIHNWKLMASLLVGL